MPKTTKMCHFSVDKSARMCQKMPPLFATESAQPRDLQNPAFIALLTP